jgi:hypothetical protein
MTDQANLPPTIRFTHTAQLGEWTETVEIVWDLGAGVPTAGQLATIAREISNNSRSHAELEPQP